MKSLPLTFSVLAGMVVGCGTYERPIAKSPTVPTSFYGSKATMKRSSTGWLDDLDDKKLAAIVNQAMQANNDLAAAAGRLRSAHAQVKVARSVRIPQVSASGSATRSRQGTKINDGFPSFGSGDTTYNLGTNLSWELDLWGRLRNRESAAQSEANAASADYHAFRLSLAANIARSWFNAIELELQVKLARDTVASLEKNLNFVERGVDLGTSEALDLRLTRANLDNSRSNLETQRRQLDSTTRSLEIILGRYPANLLLTNDTLPDLNDPVPTGLPSELLIRRPDLAASAQRVAAASERVMDVQKSFLPTFSLTESRGSASGELRKLLNPDFLAASIAARIGQTIYDGGRGRGETEAARGRFEEAMATYRQNVLQAFGEVETALASENYLNRQLRSQKKAVTESIAAEDLAWEQYSRGLVESLTWLEAQRRSFNSRSALLQLQNLRLQNRINLYLALGGDFKTRLQK